MLRSDTSWSRKPECDETILDPGQIIIDAHHHLYERPGIRYLLDEMLDDLGAGHDIRATVFVQARSQYRPCGPDELKVVGETEFARDTAISSIKTHTDAPHVCAGIVGYANLMLGEDAVRRTLEAHLHAGKERFKGIRMPLTWDADSSLLNPAYPTDVNLIEDETFCRGFALLASYNLSFDAWLYFHQIPQLTQLARRFPHIPIVLNHCGGILGVGAYQTAHRQVYKAWLKALHQLARCENVMVKLGGLGLPQTGLAWDQSERAPTSSELADIWRPWMEPCIEAFGTSRCMFESNFPADRVSYSYTAGWNALKLVSKRASSEEKKHLFWQTAARFYRLDDITDSDEMQLGTARV